MVNAKEIKEGWKKIELQITEAERFLDEKKTDEALYFTWLAAENIINTLKVSMDGFYLKEHREKTEILKKYFVLAVLKRDYSKTFEKLSKYRLVAEFHPYTSIPKDYTENDVVKFLKDVIELKNEVKNFLTGKGVLK